jgi:hypothetical protein
MASNIFGLNVGGDVITSYVWLLNNHTSPMPNHIYRWDDNAQWNDSNLFKTGYTSIYTWILVNEFPTQERYEGVWDDDAEWDDNKFWLD